MSDDPASTPSTAAILENVQQLTDIEADLADTAMAVALAPSSGVDAGPEAKAEVEAGAETTEPNPVIQNAEAMEAVLEQSIPEAPAEATEVVVQPSSALQIDPSLIDPTLSVAPPLTDVPSTSPSVQPPQDAAQEPAATVEALAANGDEIVIDDDETPAQAPTQAMEASEQPLESSVPAVSLQTPAPAAAAAELIGGPPLPEGLTSASPSVASNPDIIQDWQRCELFLLA